MKNRIRYFFAFHGLDTIFDCPEEIVNKNNKINVKFKDISLQRPQCNNKLCEIYRESPHIART